MAEEKGVPEAFRLDGGCRACVLGNMELVTHGDAAAGILEERCGRDDCSRVVAVRIMLVDASLGDILAG